jgi:hypothetical protein
VLTRGAGEGKEGAANFGGVGVMYGIEIETGVGGD